MSAQFFALPKLTKFIGYILLAYLFLPYKGNGQILNVEKSRLNSDTTKNLVGSFGFTGRVQQLQSRVINLSSLLNASYHAGPHGIILMGNFTLVKINGNKVVNTGYLHSRISLWQEKLISPEGFIQAQYDDFRGMNHRYLAGSAMRAQFINNENTRFKFSIGAMYEDESWLFQEVDSATQLVKSTNYIALHHRFNEYVSLDMMAYYQARFDRFFDPRVFGDFQLSTKLTKKFTITMSYLFLYDQIPVVPIDKLIYIFQGGIQFEF